MKKNDDRVLGNGESVPLPFLSCLLASIMVGPDITNHTGIMQL